MRSTILMFAGASLLAMSLCAVAAKPCRYSAPRNATLDAAGLQSLLVDLGPNDLVVHGQRGLTQIVVHGTACASDEKWLQDIQVKTARHGDTASVVADNGEHDISFSYIFNKLSLGSSYAYLKLDVAVPQALAVKLKVGSGDADAHDLAALDVTLGSGDLHVHGIAGELRLQVGSGDATAGDVGSLNLSSVGSGDAKVDGVRGNAQVGSVGSGDLEVRNVDGAASLGSVGSGDAKFAGVRGDVKANSVGSGDLVVDGVKGAVWVGSISSGGADIRDAGGNVRADSVGSGDFDADGVGGDFSVGSLGSGDVSHHHVTGKVSIPSDND